MKKNTIVISLLVITLLIGVIFSACGNDDSSSDGDDSSKAEAPSYSKQIEKDGFTFTLALTSSLSSWEEAGKYTVNNGNLIAYDSLVFEGSDVDISSLKDSSDYENMLKIGVTYESSGSSGATADSSNATGDSKQSSADQAKTAAQVLKYCKLYTGDGVFDPYYVLMSSDKDQNKAILLYGNDTSIVGDPVFAMREDEDMVVCEEFEAEDAADASLSAKQNEYGEAYSIEDSGTADSNFEAGNSAYHEGEFEKAEYSYLLALNKKDDLSKYKSDDVRNNLVLARLQLEKNKDALKMASDLVKRNPVDTDASTTSIQTSYGYVINFLVAAHANQLSSSTAVDDVSDVSLSTLESDLEDLADDDPGEFVHFMTALVYNEQYMEMEKYESSGMLTSIQSTLDDLNDKEYETFEEYDDDIDELKEYLSAKIDELDSSSSSYYDSSSSSYYDSSSSSYYDSSSSSYSSFSSRSSSSYY